jgi:hypothetical protein
MSNFDTHQTHNDISQTSGIPINESLQTHFNGLMIESDVRNDALEVSTDDEYMSNALGMTVAEYRDHVIRELEFITTKADADIKENMYSADITYTTEKEFIDLNLSTIQNFMGLPPDIKPIGKYSSQILEDHLYRGIPRISRDVVHEIIDNFKIIDIHEVYDKFSSQYSQLYDVSSNADDL